MKRIIVLPILFAMIVLARIITNEATFNDLIISMTNVIAMIIVIIDILIKFWNNWKKQISEQPKEIAERIIRNKSKKLIILSILVLGALSIVYLLFLRNSLLNDCISIIAMCLTLIENEIVMLFSKNNKEF